MKRDDKGRLPLHGILWMIGTWLAGVAATASLVAAEPTWPQHLGPQRNGVSSETQLMDVWPSNGPDVVWRVAGGVGMSGLAIDQGRLLTMIQDARQQYVVALNAETGKPLWKTEVAPRYRNAMGDGPRATPTIAGNRVYALTGEGTLVALQFKDGKRLWSVNVPDDVRGKTAEYGAACSPLVAGGLVIVTAGAPGATVVAYRADSGKRVWTAGRDSTGYSSPALLSVAGQTQLVVHSGSAVLGLQPKDGKVLWRFPYITDFDCNIATPISVDGNVFVTSGENHGSVLLKVTAEGTGFAVDEVWSSQGPGSVLRGEWQTPVLLDGYLYALDNVGSAGPVTHLTCVEAKTGKRIWQATRFGKSNLIGADGKLFFSTMKGDLAVVRATPKGFDEMGRIQLTQATRQAPALAGGRLYLRDGREIVCVDVRRK